MNRLRHYQKKHAEDLQYMLNKTGVAYLADEMGLGKTASALTVAKNTDSTRILVVCPASLRLNWKAEVDLWYQEVIPFVKCIFKKTDLENYRATGIDPRVLIISYDLLATDMGLKTLRNIEWDLIIYDEAHYLKSKKSKRTKVALGDIFKTAKYKLFLSGTPFPNGVQDAWPVFAKCMPQQFGSFWTFVQRYTNARKTRFGWEFKGGKNLKELSKIARDNFFVRKLKSQVLHELPDKVYSTIELEIKQSDLKKAEAGLTDEARAAILGAIKEGKRIGPGISDHVATTRRQMGLLKVSSVVTHCKMLAEAKEPFVVFAYHREVIDGIRDGLDRAGITFTSITGRTGAVERDAAVRDFQAGQFDCFVGQIQAAGVGLTLTRASTCVIAEPVWVPAELTQAIDRLHRIGQKNSVNVQFLVAAKSFDQRVTHVLQDKIKVLSQLEEEGYDEQQKGAVDSAVDVRVN